MKSAFGILLALGALGCGKRSPEAVAKDTLTTRERQEAVGQSAIPGATGITKALKVADTALARVRSLDTVGQ